MKANFKVISTLLIIVLTAILIWILFRFYNTPIKVNTPVVETTTVGNRVLSNQNIKPIIQPEIHSSEVNSGDDTEEKSGEITETQATQKIETDIPTTQKIENDSTPVIITSEDTMTNKQKREILTELDNTLMELLDVVDKVQPVDETRLITDESGVQE